MITIKEVPRKGEKINLYILTGGKLQKKLTITAGAYIKDIISSQFPRQINQIKSLFFNEKTATLDTEIQSSGTLMINFM